MFTIFIIALLVVLAASFSVYLRRIARSSSPANRDLTEPSFKGLFPAPNAAPGVSEADTRSYREANLIDRARGGYLDTLPEARADEDGELYQRVLDALIDSMSGNRESLRALVSYVSGSNELRGNARLARLVIDEWKENTSAGSTGEMAHIAALSDDAATYEQAVDLIGSAWKSGRLSGFSAEQIIELIESQYWILSREARHGGDGFALKLKVVKLRRELAAATPAR